MATDTTTPPLEPVSTSGQPLMSIPSLDHIPPPTTSGEPPQPLSDHEIYRAYPSLRNSKSLGQLVLDIDGRLMLINPEYYQLAYNENNQPCLRVAPGIASLLDSIHPSIHNPHWNDHEYNTFIPPESVEAPPQPRPTPAPTATATRQVDTNHLIANQPLPENPRRRQPRDLIVSAREGLRNVQTLYQSYHDDVTLTIKVVLAMLILGILSDNILVSCLRIALAVTTALLLKHFGIQRITNNLYDRQSAVLQLTIRSLLPHTPLDPLPGANSTNDPYAIQLARLRRFVYICYQSVFMFFASMNPTVYRIWLTEEMRRRAILAEQAERTEQDSNENNNEDNNPRNDEDQDDVNENNDTYYSDNSSSDSDESFDSDEQFYFADATGIDNGEARHRNLACRVLAGDTLVAAEED